jgi:hypothetical protein
MQTVVESQPAHIYLVFECPFAGFSKLLRACSFVTEEDAVQALATDIESLDMIDDLTKEFHDDHFAVCYGSYRLVFRVIEVGKRHAISHGYTWRDALRERMLKSPGTTPERTPPGTPPPEPN